MVDGKATTQGGAGHEIVDFTDQTLYTDTDNSGIATSPQLLSAAGFELNSTNWNSVQQNVKINQHTKISKKEVEKLGVHVGSVITFEDEMI